MDENYPLLFLLFLYISLCSLLRWSLVIFCYVVTCYVSSSLCACSHLFLLFAFVFEVVYISLNSHRIILSLNVRGTQSSTKRKALFLWLNRQEADIIFPQETYNTKEGEAFWKTQYKGKMFFLDGTNHSCGDLVYVSEG